MQVPKEFHPELIPRKGERTAWLLLILALVYLVVALWRDSDLINVAIFFVLLIFFSAGSITLGNWMDRKTVLRLDSAGVNFNNGLRNVAFKWGEVWEVRVIDSSWGRRVQVRGAETTFTFRTLGEVVLQGELKGQIGFAEGKSILKMILKSSGLQEIETGEKFRYYARP